MNKLTVQSKSTSLLAAEADRIEAAIAADTLADMPEFRNVHPESRENVARATVAAYREQLRRNARG